MIVLISIENQSKEEILLESIDVIGIDKDKFSDYLANEVTEIEEEDQPMEHQNSDRALRAFTTNLNEAVKKGKIDPVIGRIEELENVALSLGRRTKSMYC
jgi:ATP-dependent Clp protease ATP-binding subunit ClpA